MSNLRNWKAIKREVFEQSQNTLILVEDNNVTHYSKIEDKIETLEDWRGTEILGDCQILFVWTWAKRSDVFKLDSEDIERLLDNNQNK